MEIYHYVTATGRDVIGEWLSALRDLRATARIMARINRLAAGNFGDCKLLQEGVRELRIDWGPGYRVYFAITGKASALLICGGDKRTQTNDIKQAIEYLKDYKRRTQAS